MSEEDDGKAQRRARLARRNAHKQAAGATRFLLDHPDVAEAVADFLVASTGNTQQERERLCELLLTILASADRARAKVRDHSRRCIAQWRAHHDARVARDYQPLLSPTALFYGAKWLMDHKLTRLQPEGGPRDRVTVAYLRRQPWGDLTVLFVHWSYWSTMRQVGTSAHLVRYHMGAYIDYGSIFLRTEGLGFPDAATRMDEMRDRIGTVAGYADWHKVSVRVSKTGCGLAATSEQALMMLALTQGAVAEDGVVAHGGEAGLCLAAMGLEVRRLAENEFLVGGNLRAAWRALCERAA